jgi:hypothetical protein
LAFFIEFFIIHTIIAADQKASKTNILNNELNKTETK